MPTQWLEDVPKWEQEYKKMVKGLTKREEELLDGADIRSDEGMLYGRMYRDWIRRREDEQD
jgi:hypothetical protein|tara:strand:+ start:570 stop:752 length:183 start_codon:yes stop_codon:yes gene_type:complete